MSTSTATTASIDTSKTTPDLIGANLIGCGYNVATGRIARTSSVITSKPLFDLSTTTKEVYVGDQGPFLVPDDLIYSTNFSGVGSDTTTEVYSYEEATDSFGVELGVSAEGGGFSGEMSACYSQSQTNSVEQSFSFARQYRRHNFYQLVLAGEAADWRAKLTGQAKDDLENLDANALVAKYGTHFLRSGTFGAVWMYAQAISKYVATTETEIATSLEASAEAEGVKINGSTTQSSSSTSTESTTKTKLFFETIGGTSTSSYTAWENSVNDGTWGLIGFQNDTDVSLQPLSVLVDPTDTERIKEIDDAIAAALPVYRASQIRWTPDHVEYVDNGDTEQRFALDSSTESHLVITGLAFKVDDNAVTELYAELLDLDTGATGWYEEDSSGKHTRVSTMSFESKTEVGRGYVLTGLALKSSKKKMNSAKLYGQLIDPRNFEGNNYLGKTVKAFGSQDDPEVKYVPISGNQQIIYGLKIAVKNEKVATLVLNIGTFKKQQG